MVSAVVGLVMGVIEIDGVAGTFLLLLPFILLAAVILLVRRRSAPRPKQRKDPAAVVAAMAEAPAEPRAAAPAPVPDPVPPLVTRIGAAEASNDHAALAGLHLTHAKAHMAAERHGEAADALRASLRAATLAKNKKMQAEARLELAELARAAGDLTTACEHWQMARSLFLSEKQTKELAETEAAMRRHGCPTDWVLNDF